VIWVSDKVWNSLNDEQKNGSRPRPTRWPGSSRRRQLRLEHDSNESKLQKMGVKFVEGVDKVRFSIKDAEPLQGQISRGSSGRRRQACCSSCAT